jgi:hypothetical protein
MTQPLFFEPAKYLEKYAAQVDLPEDPNLWPQEILQELYKQVPYIADFEPHVTMDRVDAEKGYGLGHVEVSPQTEAQMGTPQEQLQTAGVRTVRVPIVIKNGKLYPFDILITDDSKMLPLTESRIRQTIFRPQAFDVTARTPGDLSMIGQLYPPYRQNHGFGGGGGSMNVGMGKESSVLEEYLTKKADALDDYMASSVKHERLGKKYKVGEVQPGMLDDFIKNASAIVSKMVKKGSVLKAILPTINEGDYTKFASALSTTDVQSALLQNKAALSEALSTLSSYNPSSEKISSALANFVKPDVVQIRKDVDCYIVKSANHKFWEPLEEKIERRELVQRFGEKVALAADTEGAVTMADGADAAEQDVDTSQIGPVATSGLYKVKDVNGSEHIGYVIINLLDTDGDVLPLSLFTNGSKAAVQSDIVGMPAGEGFELPTADLAQGAGFFFTGQGDQIQATIPFELQGGSYDSPDGMMVYVGETFDGRPVEVSQQPNIQSIYETEEGRILVPQHWQWSPLEAADALDLVGTEAEEPKEASAKRAIASVYIRSDGSSFSIDGPSLMKIATDAKNFLGLDDAMFLLAGLGVKQDYGVKKLGQALAQREPIQVRIGRVLHPASESKLAAIHAASELKLVNLRQDLTKEALFIPDPIAVDTVLSLGFINPENLMTFISYLPVLEESQTRMCELLLATRLGLEAVSESALEKAVRATEEVLEGLKVLAFQGV